jgi:LysM repeat protein
MMRKLARVATLLFLVMLMSGLSGAQGENLLRNPGFEAPYLDGSEGQVAEGWASWFVGAPAERPDYMQAPTDRAISGDAQAYSSFLSVHRAGLYQSVSGLTAGAMYTFSANVWVWSTRNDLNPEVSEDPGVVTIEVGIDTTGAIDPEGSSIIWSTPVEMYDAFVPVSVSAAPTGDTVTVFVRTIVNEARLLTEVYVDDAALTVESVVEPATPEPTAEPVEPTQDVAQPTEEAAAPTEESVPPTEAVIEATAETAPTETAAAPTDIPAPTDNPFLSTITHVVQQGDSYDLIARTYGSTVAAIKEANNVAFENNLIYPGDVLIVPVPVPPVEATDASDVTDVAPQPTALPTDVPTDVPTEAPTEVPTEAPTVEPTAEPTAAPTEETSTEPTAVVELQTTYTVQRGDTLMDIASRFDLNVIELGRVNNILNYNLIYVGQVLALPGQEPETASTPAPTNTPEPVRHFVQFGDSIYRIAARYGVTSQAIIEANGIENPNRIYYGQVLIIPR